MRERKLASEKAPLDKECTFKPALKRSKSAPRARTDNNSGVAIHERLYDEMARQKENLKQAQKRRQQEIAKACSFKPQVRALLCCVMYGVFGVCACVRALFYWVV